MTDVLGLRNPEDDAMLAGLAAAAAASPSSAAPAAAAAPASSPASAAAASPPAPAPRDEFASFGSVRDEAPISAKIFSETTEKQQTQQQQPQSSSSRSSRRSRRRSRSKSHSRSRSRSARSSTNRHAAGSSSSSSSSSRSPPHPAAEHRASASSLSSASHGGASSARSARSSAADLSAIGSDTMHMHAGYTHNTPTRPHASHSDASERDQHRHSHRERDRGDDHRASSKRSSGAATPASARYNTFGETDRAPGSSHSGGSSHRGSGGNSHHRRSGESSELAEARALLLHSESLPHWLAAAGFDESISARLTAAGALCVPHALRLTKAGLKQMLGVKDGLRVHLALRDAEKAQRIIDEHAAAAAAFTAGGSDHSGAPSPASSRSRPPRLPASSYLPPSLADVPAGLSDSLVGTGGAIHRELHPAGMYGYCAVADCDLPAPVQCATKHCGKGLCNYHANKMLLTGSTVCASCYENTTIMDNVKQATGIVALQENGYLQQDCSIQ